MATTVRTIIETAHRLIGVVAQDEPMTADQGDTGLVAFNNMVSAWELDGIVLSPAFTDAALADNFPLADKFREGTGYMLAKRLAPQYTAPQGFDADDFFRKIQASYATITQSTINPALTWKGATRKVGVFS